MSPVVSRRLCLAAVGLLAGLGLTVLLVLAMARADEAASREYNFRAHKSSVIEVGRLRQELAEERQESERLRDVIEKVVKERDDLMRWTFTEAHRRGYVQ